jgi:hypothetical protein
MLQAAEMAATATLSGPAGVKSVPVFTLAATSGQGLSILHTFLSHLQPKHPAGALGASSEEGNASEGADVAHPVAVGTIGEGWEDGTIGVASAGGESMHGAGSNPVAGFGDVRAPGGITRAGLEGQTPLVAKVRVLCRSVGWEFDDFS